MFTYGKKQCWAYLKLPAFHWATIHHRSTQFWLCIANASRALKNCIFQSYTVRIRQDYFCRLREYDTYTRTARARARTHTRNRKLNHRAFQNIFHQTNWEICNWSSRIFKKSSWCLHDIRVRFCTVFVGPIPTHPCRRHYCTRHQQWKLGGQISWKTSSASCFARAAPAEPRTQMEHIIFTPKRKSLVWIGVWIRRVSAGPTNLDWWQHYNI